MRGSRASGICLAAESRPSVEDGAKPVTRNGVKPRRDVIGQDHLFLVWVARSTLGKCWPGPDAAVSQSASRVGPTWTRWTPVLPCSRGLGSPGFAWLALAKHHKTVGLTARDVM